MSVNIHKIINCPICQIQLTITLSNFAGQLQLVCNRCECNIVNWVDSDLKNQTNTSKRFTKTGSNPRKPRSHTAKRIPVQSIKQESPNVLNKQNTHEISRAIEETKTRCEKMNKEPNTKKRAPTQPIKKFSLPKNSLERIGDYHIIKPVNSGSMGEIYLAQHIGVKNYAAIKLLSSQMEKDSQAAERFKQEARVHSRLEHPNIVGIFDVDSYNGRPYIVMEYIEGESLEEVLRNRKQLQSRHTLKIAIAVALALEHALKQKIIHRDLKPANIMIDRRNRKVKLADFGLGKILEEKGLTQPGQMMGTAYYMAPEQIRNAKEADHRADIYALGATIYHMLSGQPPYANIKGALDILKAKINEQPEPIENLVSGLSREVIDIVNKSMHHSINKRYQTPAKMKKSMESALNNL
ncbi:serine/threonine protein kinase [Candidatus Uabimicrobium sp. HlEnr_7]|uniref:serine/threonine protein kinase n=1 Tax=Candidatus Uabimicrobium helgolandensis TaxID=3095367 RepID=UPI00355927E6